MNERSYHPSKTCCLLQVLQQGKDIVHESAHLHVTGSATYIDDIPEHAGTLYAALILSPVAHGELIGDGIDREAILQRARRGGGLHRQRHPRRKQLRPHHP